MGKLIGNLPGSVVQNAAHERAMKELIEEMTKKKAEEVAEKMPAAEPDNWEEDQLSKLFRLPWCSLNPKVHNQGSFSVGFQVVRVTIMLGLEYSSRCWQWGTKAAGIMLGAQTPGEAKTAGP